jgi:serine/threonine protein kinase/Tfp pilus assembly protein PilF
MNSERLHLIERIYLEASSLDKNLRDEFLRNACQGDEGLRNEINSLLAQENSAERFMESSAFQELAASLADGWTEASAQNMEGSLGRYQILEKLGAGGMGIVYRARDTILGRVVALKVLPPGLIANKGLRARFVREAKAASGLNHPNIITIYDIGQADGIDFIAMEYVQGQTVRNIIAERKLELSEALDYAIQTARALYAAHRAGIIHRDIKPENIMVINALAESRQVKLLDFGLAKLSELHRQDESVDLSSIKGAIFGTASYMSPEQAEGKSIDARSDIFSLGAVLYEMLSGRKAFEGKSNFSILNAVVHKEAKPVEGIPKQLWDILSGCLSKDPNLRFQNARNMELALAACRSIAGVFSGHSTSPEFPLETDFKTSAKTMLAVLPFSNLSRDREQDYFSDGLTEEMITELGRLNPKRLGVIAPTTAMHLRDSGKSVEAIGTELGVEYILEGSVRRAGDRVRIAVQLIYVRDQTFLWTATYDRQLQDILDIQQDVAKRTAQSLAMELLPSAYKAGSRAGSRVADAHELYLRGLYYWNLRTEESFRTAIELLEKAIELDPGYALAHSGLAMVYDTFGNYSGIPPDSAGMRAKDHARKALAIDNALAEAHAALGYALLLFDWDWDGSEAAFQTAINNNPNYIGGHHWYALKLALQGRFDDAVQRMDKALQLDPLSFVLNSHKGWILYFARRDQEAANQMHCAIQMDANFAVSHYFLGLVYLQMAKLEDAIQEFSEARKLSGNHPASCAGLGLAHGLLGRKAEALRHLETLNSLAGQRHVSPYFYSLIYLGLGDTDAAMVQLEAAYAQRCCWIAHLYVDPMMDTLRPNPRFQDLLRCVGFPQEAQA